MTNSYYQIVDLSYPYTSVMQSFFFTIRDNVDIFGEINWFIKDRKSDPANIRVFRYQTKKQWDTAYNEWLKKLNLLRYAN